MPAWGYCGGGGALVGFRLQVNLTIASLLYLTIVLLLSVTDAVLASIFVSVVAVLCLDYFFAPPIFSLELSDPLDTVALIAFLATALLINRLMSLRKRAEEALQKVLADLELKVQERTAELAKANDELRGEITERQRAQEGLQKAQAVLTRTSAG
jgi:K+-sensing histidine kinase KdpD